MNVLSYEVNAVQEAMKCHQLYNLATFELMQKDEHQEGREKGYKSLTIAVGQHGW